MNRGLEQGLIQGNTKGLQSGLIGGLKGMVTSNRTNILDPRAITDPKLKPVFYINADTVALVSGGVSYAYNLIDSKPGDLMVVTENVFTQNAGTTYRPPLLRNELGGRNVFNFADTSNRYLISGQLSAPAFYAQSSPSASGTGFTYIFIVKRKPGGTYTIFDGRDSSTLPTPNDLLLEVNAAGRLVFEYRGGAGGSTTSLLGTAGVNLLNDYSIVTVKAQLREDGGFIPSDTDGPSPIAKRYYKPLDGIIGDPIQIFVNGIEQQKTVTTNTYTNADYFGDQTFRMLNRDMSIGNKASTYATSGTYIAAALMIPAYIPYAMQQKLENYFRAYYGTTF